MENRPAAREESLYGRLGGYDAIASVIGEYYARVAADEKLARFFTDVDSESLLRLRELTADMICKAAGGPYSYTGRSMGESHKSLGISEEDWEKSLGYFEEALDQFNVNGKEREDILSLISSLREEIIQFDRQPGCCSQSS